MKKGYGLWVMGYGSRKITSLFIFLVVLSILVISYSYGETISSKELVKEAKNFDGKRVSYAGEAVTAIMARGEYSWVNLNDGDNAIGIWCKSGLLKDIVYIGGYKIKGDILQVEGIFNRACAIHKGELDIHAERCELIRQGCSITEKVDRKRIVLSAGLFILTFLLMVLLRKRT